MCGRKGHSQKTGQIGVNTCHTMAISQANTNSTAHPSFLVKERFEAVPALPRSERYRNTDNLKDSQVQDLIEADIHAAGIGLPLNMFLTISWSLTNANDLNSQAFEQGIRAMKQWLRNHNVPPTWLYVHENPVSVLGDNKPNTHMLLHLPRRIARRDFLAMLHGWFKSLDGGVDLRPRTISGYFGPDRLPYMCKGAPQKVCWKRGWRRKRGGQGTITIKRSGTSQNIGRSARLIPSQVRKAA